VEQLLADRGADADSSAYRGVAGVHPAVRVANCVGRRSRAEALNAAVKDAGGEIICLIDQYEAADPDWLTELVGHATRREVGAVGAKLYNRQSRIEHAGVVLGLGRVEGRPHRGLPRTAFGYQGRAQVVQNYAAVSGQCLALRKQVFQAVGGFDSANLPDAYSDLDLCLRIREQGYHIVWTPYAELHLAARSDGGANGAGGAESLTSRAEEYMKSRWGELLRRDPYYNPNLSLDGENLSLASPPRVTAPWE
jgi:GT2 family glycosyltransferase